MALLFVVALQVHGIDDSDTWWHLASGRLIAAERAVAHGDPFSYTAPGAIWINHEWLTEYQFGWLWRHAGNAGLWMWRNLMVLIVIASMLSGVTKTAGITL